MTYEKVALVIIFLGVLLAAQIYLYTRSRSNPKMQASIKDLKVVSRLNLSKNSVVSSFLYPFVRVGYILARCPNLPDHFSNPEVRLKGKL